MRRLGMKNKRRISETSNSSESDENGGEHVSSNDANDSESQPSKNNDRSTPVVRKSSSKRRSLRGASVQKSAAHMSDDNDMKDDSPESEQENGEKTERKSLFSKRGRKSNRKASTSKNNKADIENEYEVEKLINHRTIKGRQQFLVRWKGYGDSADTWENEKDLNCFELVEEFLAKEKEIKSLKEEERKLSKAKARSDKSKRSRIAAKKHDDDSKDDKEDLTEFEVEKIIEVHFKKNGKREFLIRWKGFNSADDSWEPEENLNCSELISKFMQKLEKVKTVDMRELRTNPAHTKRYTLTTHDSGRRLSKRNMDKQRATYHECDE